MQMEGANYVGLLGKVLADLDLSDMEKRWDLAGGKPLLMKDQNL
ncbi:MAG: hypothetical protein AAFY76_03130 [Cyanobacteria bacterium J06649_11]